jgi:putative oxidoreductase
MNEVIMNNLIKKTLVSNAGLEAVILRVPIGLILAAHGSQKLFAWFGGYGLEGTGQWMATVGLNLGFLMASLAGSAEFFGGVALILGLLTRPAAVINAVTMLVALFWVHWAKAFFWIRTALNTRWLCYRQIRHWRLSAVGGIRWML